jgi:hypothetical protein
VKAAAEAIRSEVVLLFAIRNFGARGRFSITALPEGKLVKRIEPGIFEIAASSEGRSSVFLPARPATNVGKEIEVRVVASQGDSADPHLNSGVQRASVVKN